MKKKKKNRKIPLQLLAARKGTRDAEKENLGEGFHARTRVMKSKKVYSRKTKHRDTEEE